MKNGHDELSPSQFHHFLPCLGLRPSKTFSEKDVMLKSRRTFIRSVILLGLLGLADWNFQPSRAATNIVLAGEDLQARINEASAGDVMVVQSGAYGGAITIAKALTFVRSGTGAAQLQGPVSVNTAGALAVAQFTFADTVTVQGGAAVSAVESRFEGELAVTGGKLTIRRCQFNGELRLNNAALTALRCTNQAWIVAVADPNSRVPMALAQCNISGSVSTIGYAVALGYSKLVSLGITDGEGSIVGNKFRRTEADGGVVMHSAIYGLRSKLNVSNNDIWANVAIGANGLYRLRLSSCDATIVNNTIALFGRSSTHYVYPVGLYGAASSIRIHGSILVASSAQFENAAVSYWPDFEGPLLVSHSCLVPTPPYGSLKTADSLFTDPKLNPDNTLAPDSPCVNTGPADAIHNDRDGTRNDMGFAGGPLYNPANFTTDSPMAFWLNTTPRKVVKGSSATIRIDAAATAGH